MRNLAQVLVWSIAVLELLVVVGFALLSTSGDEFGIARALAGVLAVPFVVLAVPAVIVVGRGRPGLAVLLALLSLASTFAAWSLA